MNKTKIDWATMTWNPVTGCLNECEYCYARQIAHRYRDQAFDQYKIHYASECTHDLCSSNGSPYPYDFAPTFHRYRLEEPQRKRKPQNIFVCSMADLFGSWVPDEWISEVFEACLSAPQHNYMFLTKSPHRYSMLSSHCKLPRPDNFWYGTTITNQRAAHAITGEPYGRNRFLSIEPLMGPIRSSALMDYDWVIIGAETGNRKDKVIPWCEWIADLVSFCREWSVPVFMKSSLAGIWGEPLVQEYPDILAQNMP